MAVSPNPWNAGLWMLEFKTLVMSFKELPFHIANEPSRIGNGLMIFGLGFCIHGIYYTIVFLGMFKILRDKKLTTEMSFLEIKQVSHECFQIT